MENIDKKTLLIIQPRSTLRYAIEQYSSKLGFSTRFAKDGSTAASLVRAEKIDIIVMDVESKNESGFETISNIRQNSTERWIPIIVCTGLANEEDLERAINAGADDYLVLPVSETILAAKIKVMERIVDMQEELAKKTRKLAILAERDSLTGLYNRRAFLEKLTLIPASEGKTNAYLLMIDIDHFKLFNDEYGHPAGDECIKKVANVLSEALRGPTDLVARYGGEEFIALFRSCDPTFAEEKIESIRLAVMNLNIENKKSTTSKFITISIGCHKWIMTNRDINSAIQISDSSLYEAKKSGRNKYLIN